MSDIPQPGPPVFHTRSEPESLTLAEAVAAGIVTQHRPEQPMSADIVRQEVFAALGVPHDANWQQALEILRMLARDTTYSERWAAQLLDARNAGQAASRLEVRVAMGVDWEWGRILDELKKRAF